MPLAAGGAIGGLHLNEEWLSTVGTQTPNSRVAGPLMGLEIQ